METKQIFFFPFDFTITIQKCDDDNDAQLYIMRTGTEIGTYLEECDFYNNCK